MPIVKNGYRVMIIQSSEISALLGYFEELLYLTLEPLFHRHVDHIVCRHGRLFLRMRE